MFPSDYSQSKVAVVGLGYVGSCIAAMLADRGLDVIGVDTDPRLIEEYQRGVCRFQEPGLAELMRPALANGKLHPTTDLAAVGQADVVLIVVGTPVREDGSLADGQLRSACAALSEHLRAGQLVVLKSTVPPGTTRELARPLLEGGGLKAGKDFHLAYTPERLAEGTALHELRTIPIVAGGLDEASTRQVTSFWRTALGIQVLPVDSLEAAEIVKLADNWWIDLNIALANELAKFCALFDVDVLDVIAAANTVPKGKGNINILLPSVGVGGSCLTKDPWMVWHAASERGLDVLTAPAGREVNAGMPDYSARLILSELAKLGKDPQKAKVAVLGLAFKNDTGDLRATPVQGTVSALTKAGAEVRIFDPLVDAAHAQEIFELEPAGSVVDAARDADCIAVLAKHRQFDRIDFGKLPVAKSCVLFDGRAYYDKPTIAKLRGYGYIYRGIGR